MEINTFKRYEKKFLLDERQRERLLEILGCHMEPDKYCVDGKNYSVYNIYYDTADNEIIHRSLTSSWYKEKLRLRSYKPMASPNDQVGLEIKKKIRGIVSKRRAALKLWEAERFIDTGEKPSLAHSLDAQIINEIEHFLQRNSVRPKVFISYDRHALFGKDNAEFRLTIDSNIQAKRGEPFDSSYKPIMEEGFYIMEVKITDSIPLWLSRAMSELGIKRISFSKYGTEYRRYLAGKTEVKRWDSFLPPGFSLASGDAVLDIPMAAAGRN